MLGSIVAGVVANTTLALAVDGLGPALALRFVTGLAMAGAYPPSMKIIASSFRERRGRAIGVLIGALTVGSAIPHFIRGVTDLPWRPPPLAACALATSRAVLGWTAVGRRPDGFR